MANWTVLGHAHDAARGFLCGIGHWQWHGYGFFIVTDRVTGQALGRVGILNHEGWPEPELAYHLYDGAEGKSIAYEAACAVRQWAGTDLNMGPLVSIIDPDNTRSRALAARLGATVERMGTHEDEAAVFYRHLGHDDPKAQAQWSQVAA